MSSIYLKSITQTQRVFGVVLWIIFASMLACVKKPREKSDEQPMYQDPHRPQFHFTPVSGWMNDPNGMVYLDGEYHLFYQHNPDSTIWGPMHWGHAISKDLIHWEQMPIALYPDSLGTIFSGSAVVDEMNTSGLGSPEHPAMVAIFTYHSTEREKAGYNDFQNQGIAYSADKGRTWKKYERNPIIRNPGKRDFRDPKVFWHTPSAQWVLVLAAYDHVEFYASKNLKEWKHLSDFGFFPGEQGRGWECPDFFELKISGSIEKKWVLLVSVNPGAYNGGSGTQYFIGQFDGKGFQSDPGQTLWIDYGKDNYAGVTWSNVPKSDERRLFMGWMSNWQYANVVPTEVWRSAMTIPRELSLINTDNGIRLASWPVTEIKSLKAGNEVLHTNIMDAADTASEKISLPQSGLEINLDIERDKELNDFELEFSNPNGEKVLIGLEGRLNQIYLDRDKSGDVDFSKQFGGRHIGIRQTKNKNLNLTLLLDLSSLELFTDDGTLAMTEIFFPSERYTQLIIRSRTRGIRIKSLRLNLLKSIW